MVFVLACIHWAHVATQGSIYRALQHHGVIVSATVLHSTYDPSGGDPNGWTEDTIALEARQRLVTVVGHHGDNEAEERSGRLRVIYDRSDPARVMALATYRGVTPGADLIVAAIGALVCGLLVLVFVALSFSWTRRRGAHPS